MHWKKLRQPTKTKHDFICHDGRDKEGWWDKFQRMIERLKKVYKEGLMNYVYNECKVYNEEWGKEYRQSTNDYVIYIT